MNLALKEITGSKNVLVEDDLGTTSVMVKIPRFNLSDVISGAPDTPHPMFIVDGVVKDSIYVGKFLSTVWDQRAYSLPGRDPAVNMSLDDAKKYAYNKGEGWHVMSNAERSGIALWCKANGYFPYGNTNGGKNYTKPVYRGTTSIKTNSGTYSVGDIAKASNLGTDDFVEFNKSNATAMTIDSYEGASADGTTFVGGKLSCTIDAGVADKIEKMEFYMNKRSDSVCDTLNLVAGVNQTPTYNSLKSDVPCILKDGSIYKMWFAGTDSSSKLRILYAESTDMVNWTNPMVVMDLTASVYANTAIWRPCVLKVATGFKMWFEGIDSARCRILQSNSTDGIHWTTPTVDVNVDTSTGSKTNDVEHPWVIQESDGSFTMWFTGLATNKIARTFRTTSVDGNTWNVPVLVLDCTITPDNTTFYGSHELTVVKDGGIYKMWYLCIDATGNNILYRESTDGITWGNSQVSLAMMTGISLNSIADGWCMPSIYIEQGIYYLFTTVHNTNDGKNRIYRTTLPDKKTVPIPIVSMAQNTVTLNAGGSRHPFVIKDGSTYKMWFNGILTNGTNGSILYTESADGNTWAAPILALSYTTYSGAANFDSPYVIKESDTSYKMWLGFSGVVNSIGRQFILYSTSVDGKVWTTPVLSINYGTTTYSTTSTMGPSVIKESATSYKMWMIGNDGTNMRILYSTSTDGITWTTPVLSINIGGKYINVGNCRVIKESSTLYRMWIILQSSTQEWLAYTESTDGINWGKYIISKEVPGNTADRSISTPSVINDNGTWKLWYGSYDSSGNTCIKYITSPIPQTFGLTLNVDVLTASYNAVHSQQPSVIYDSSDSKYKMWFSGQDASSTYRIFYTESLDLVNWTTPIVVQDTNTCAYNTSQIASPTVYKNNSGTYMMWAEAFDGTTWKIVYSTSTDGKHWTVPVLVMSSTTNHIAEPKVIHNSDGSFSMWYRSQTTTTLVNSTYMVKSADGISWSAGTLCNNIYNVGTTRSFDIFFYDNKYHAFINLNTQTTVYHQFSYDGINWMTDTVSKQTFLQSNLNAYFAKCGPGVNIVKVNDRFLIMTCGYDGANNRLMYGYTPFLTQGNRIKTIDSSGVTRIKRIDNATLVIAKGISTPTANYMQTPCVIKESDTSYKMWLSVRGSDSAWRVGYSTSVDGKIWSAPVVVVDKNTIASNSTMVYSPFVIKESDTSYKMWFTGGDSITNYRILYATSTDGINWTTPIMIIDIGGTTYNTKNSYDPFVIKESDTLYRMWFVGTDANTINSILYTTSTDGKTWITPVLVSSIAQSSFTDSSIDKVYIIKESATSYKMWFTGQGDLSNASGHKGQISYATSSDGINWSTPINISNPRDVYSAQDIFGPSIIKESDTLYRMWFNTTDLIGDNFIMYAESTDGVTNWCQDVSDPIVLKNISYTAAQNSADGYINANITSIQPGYVADAVFKYQTSATMQRLQMRNTKKVHFEIRSASSLDGKVNSNMLIGEFYTNGDIQDVFLQVNSRSSDSSVYIYSKSGSALIASVSPDDYYIAGQDGEPNDDGIVINSSTFITTGDNTDSYAKITIAEVYGDIDIIRTLTGTCGTGHDNTPDGIMDLTGNVWEMVTGLKLVGGQINVTPNNDSALQFYDDSDCLQAIDQSGNLVDPSTAKTLYIDGATASANINTSVTKIVGDSGVVAPFVSIGATAGVTVPVLLKTLGLFPVDANDHGDSVIRYKNIGIGMPIIGGDANSQLTNGGPFTVSFLMGEGLISPSVGFRVCYYEP